VSALASHVRSRVHIS